MHIGYLVFVFTRLLASSVWSVTFVVSSNDSLIKYNINTCTIWLSRMMLRPQCVFLQVVHKLFLQSIVRCYVNHILLCLPEVVE